MFIRMLAAFACLVAAASPACAVRFDFAFTASLQNGSDPVGSGTFTANTPDANGAYEVIGVTGSVRLFDGDTLTRTFQFVSGALFSFDPAYILTRSDGTFYTEGLVIYGDNFFAFGGPQGDDYFILSDDFVSGTGQLQLKQVSGVPEPATWAMLMLGFGLIGAAARGRRRGVVAV